MVEIAALIVAMPLVPWIMFYAWVAMCVSMATLMAGIWRDPITAALVAGAVCTGWRAFTW